MAKAQHSPSYRIIPPLLRELRESAKLTQRALGAKLRKPQSWIYNCESANRRVDVTELIAWCRGCGADPARVFARVMDRVR
jgi:hypothetical protein